MNNLLYLAHAGHAHQHSQAEVKGGDAVMIAAIAAIIVFAAVIIFYTSGNKKAAVKDDPKDIQ